MPRGRPHVNACVVHAVGVNRDGFRESLGLDVVTSEDGAGWLAYMRGLVARGLAGAKLVSSDAHLGLVDAIAATLPGASWQRIAAAPTTAPKRIGGTAVALAAGPRRARRDHGLLKTFLDAFASIGLDSPEECGEDPSRAGSGGTRTDLYGRAEALLTERGSPIRLGMRELEPTYPSIA